MAGYPIPYSALDDRLAFIGTSGSGKTYSAGTAVERLLSSGAKVVIVDPLGVWWGLRLKADGKAPAFSLPIFGGQHGDLPLNEGAGRLIGETVAGMRESCIVDLSALQTKEAERRFMLAFLEALYRHAGGDPMHAIFDEADLWAPQNPSKQGAGPQLQALMEQIVRRGRVRGFIPWLITQRPAVISKDVLSQADGLIAFTLTASQDRNAIRDWVRGQADEGQWPALDAKLPTLEKGSGEALIWLPARGKLTIEKFPVKATFDSSATPKRGEKKMRRDLKPLDLGALKERLGSIEAETKANDPAALKAEIARLNRELAATKRARPADQPPSNGDIDRQLAEARASAAAGWDRANAAESKLAKIGKILGSQVPERIVRMVDALPPERPARRQSAQQNAAPGEIRASDGSIPSGTAKPLAALAAAYPAGMTEAQWALAAGYKSSGGTWGTYKSRLRQAGLVEARDGRWFATETGASPVETPPPPGPELVRWWAAKLSGTRPMAEALIAAYPNRLSKEELAAQIGMSASGGSFGTYLSRLASPGIIDRNGGIRLTDEVMIG